MPTYDYQCKACDHAFEHYQSIKAKPLRKCPSCGQRRVVRLIGTGGGVIFKGSGFYGTDYRSEHYMKRAKQEKEKERPKSEQSESKDSSGSKTSKGTTGTGKE